jgi:hypothetical protein
MKSHSGTVLVIVLILLTLLSVLALAGAATANAELVMASHEQYRKRASEAASSGIELAMMRIRVAVALLGTTVITSDHAAITMQYVGDEGALPGTSIARIVGHHYQIDSTGDSLRGAVEIQSQGALAIEPTGGIHTYSRLEGGLP